MRNFVPFLLILFIIAALLRVDFFFTIAYLFFAVYLLSRLWTRRTVKHLRVQRRFVNRAFLGDRVTVDLTVQNAGCVSLHGASRPGAPSVCGRVNGRGHVRRRTRGRRPNSLQRDCRFDAQDRDTQWTERSRFRTGRRR